GRTQSMQAAVLRAAIATVIASRSRYRITDYRWFDLRDADSSSSSLEDHYGLMDDRYAPKAAFNAYQTIIGTPPPGGRSPKRTCLRYRSCRPRTRRTPLTRAELDPRARVKPKRVTAER